MIKVIETNLSFYPDSWDALKDHQSRVIEVDSWEDYIQEIKEVKSISRNSVIGNLHGVTIPNDATVYNLNYDDFHLDCDVINRFGIKSKKLCYKV